MINEPTPIGELSALQRLISQWFERQDYDTWNSDIPTKSTLRKPWRHLSAKDKFAVIGVAAANGRGLAFNLNLSKEREAMLLSSSDPARAFANELQRNARNVLGHPLEMAFSFEVSNTNRLHVHGILELPPHLRSKREAVKNVIKRTGGKFDGSSSGRQLMVRSIWDGIGWQRYCFKDRAATQRQLGIARTEHISTGYRRRARQFHSRYRNTSAGRHSISVSAK
jgi:hypothetical protein